MRHPRQWMGAADLRPKKDLGQHFLTSEAVVGRILAEAAVGPDEAVLEIGPGLGALTLGLAARAGRLVAVEKDARLVGPLRTELMAAGRGDVEVVEGSILASGIARLARPGERLVVVGNLPYNISSQVLVRLVQERAAVDRAVLMFQKELAERITARPGGRDYGRLTVLLAYAAEVRRCFDVAADRFYPRPKVDSTVVAVRFKPAPEVPAQDEALFGRVVQAAFGQRRKTLRNALAGSALGLDAQSAAAVLAAAGIDARRRAETLTVGEFVGLSDCLHKKYFTEENEGNGG